MRLLVFAAIFAALLPLGVGQGLTTAQDIPHVEIRLTPQATGRPLDAPDAPATAVVHVEVICRLPSALAPGWDINHRVTVDPPVATVVLSSATWKRSLPASACADGTTAHYQVELDIDFDDTTYRGGAIRFTFYANASLTSNPSASVGWDEIAGIRGGVDIVAKTQYEAAVGTPLHIEVMVVDRTTVPIIFSGRQISAPELGTATGSGGGMLQPGEGKALRIIYTPSSPGADRLEWVVSANAEGARIAERTFTFEVDVTPDPTRVAVEENLIPAPSLAFSLALVGALFGALRRRSP